VTVLVWVHFYTTFRRIILRRSHLGNGRDRHRESSALKTLFFPGGTLLF